MHAGSSKNGPQDRNSCFVLGPVAKLGMLANPCGESEALENVLRLGCLEQPGGWSWKVIVEQVLLEMEVKQEGKKKTNQNNPNHTHKNPQNTPLHLEEENFKESVLSGEKTAQKALGE